MFKYFHLTKLQWQGILRWSLYGLLTLLVLLLQTVVLSQNHLPPNACFDGGIFQAAYFVKLERMTGSSVGALYLQIRRRDEMI